MSRRRQRKLERVKPQKGKVSSGFPKQEEARQGHSTTKYIEGKGLYEFTYYNNQWYSKKLNPAKQLDYTETQNILTDSITLNPQGEILIGQSSNIAGLKANQIENTPEAGVLRADYSGHLSTLNLGGAVSKPGDIGFKKEEGSQSFEFMQNQDKKLTYDGTSFKSINNTNDGNPIFQLGSSDTECFKISCDYKGGEKGLMTTNFSTLTAGGDANAGKMFFSVGGARKLEINDSDLTIMGLGSATADTEALIIENDVSAASMTNTRTSIAFYQEAYNASGSDALADSAKITVGTTGNWTTADANTHDAYMSFATVLDGTMKETLRLYGNGVTAFTLDATGSTEYMKMIPHATDSELDITGNFVLDATGDIELNADGSTITFKDASQTILTVEGGGAPSLTMESLTYGDSFSITMDVNAKVTLATVDQSATAGYIVLDADGDIELNADGGQVNINDGADACFIFDMDGPRFRILDDANNNDFFTIDVGAEGATTITTVDHDTDEAHLNLNIDGDIYLNAQLGTSSDNIGLKNSNTMFGAFQVHHSASWLYLYENGGASTDDYLALQVEANAETKIFTHDAAGTAGHITLDADGDITLDAASGNIICLDAGSTYTPSANNHVATKNYVDGTHKWHYHVGSRFYTRYDNWYFPSASYGVASVNWSATYAASSLPTYWYDSYNPCIVVPEACKINSYHIYGNFTSSQTYEFALLKGSPSYGSAGNTSLSQIGATQSQVATSGVYYKLEQTGLNVSCLAGDILLPCLRRTTTDTSSYYYFEFALNIVGTVAA